MRLILLILSLGLLFRLYVVLESTWIPASDQRDYYTLAKNLYDGEGYIQIYHGESAHYEGMTFRAYRSPGYPIFLSSLFKIFSPAPLVGLLSNAFLDTITLLIIMLISKSFFGLRSACIAGALYSCNFLWAPLLMTESLFTFLFISTVFVSYTVSKPSQVTLLLVGLLVTCTVFVRPIGIILIPFLALKWRLTPRSIATLLIPVLISTSMWTYRNFKLFNEIVPMTTNFGAHNASDFDIDKSALISQLRDSNKNEAEINTELTRRIFENIKSDIPRAISIYSMRVKNLFISPTVSEVSLLLKSVLKNSLLKSLIEIWTALLPSLLIFSLLNCIAQCLFGNEKGDHLAILFLSICFVVLHGFISNGNIRFAAPLTALLMVYSGSIFRRVRSR